MLMLDVKDKAYSFNSNYMLLHIQYACYILMLPGDRGEKIHYQWLEIQMCHELQVQ